MSPTPLDPIVSLSVAIAERPSSFAFFLGSGVSRDAGVPTGAEVFWQAVAELYGLDQITDTTPDEEELRRWLADTGRADATYSDVLELIGPDAATRRDYLAKHFEGVEPGPTHERLAEMVSQGLVSVFVTTNFDRLLERALQARGIEPVVVTSDADLGSAPRREHSDCWVLKPHGDYLQQTIRNTPSELARLEPGITTELQEVFDRYGIVILGYSGADEAIAAAMRARRSSYGLYWVARSDLVEPARSLVEAVHGRVILRDTAADFTGDLQRRLAVFASHPSGLTPTTVNDQVVRLLRDGDRVGLRELLRQERRVFEEAVFPFIAEHQSTQPTKDLVLETHRLMLAALERRLASLAPLALHDVDALDEEVSALADLKGRLPLRGGYSFWPGLLDWCLWWLGFVLGALALRERRTAALGPLLNARMAERYRDPEPVVQFPGDSGVGIGQVIMAQVDEQKWLSPAFESLRRDMASLPLLQECYPELFASDGEPLQSLIAFDFVLNIALGIAGFRAMAHWTMYVEPGTVFAAQLHRDARQRQALADALGLTLEEFDEKADGALGAAYALGSFGGDRGAQAILKHGNRGA